jgi:hypothetical protein
MPRTDHFELVTQCPKPCGLAAEAMIDGFSRGKASNQPLRRLPALSGYRDLAYKGIHDELRHSFHNQLSEANATDARYHTPTRSMVQRRRAMSHRTAVPRASARTCEVASIEIVVDIILHCGFAMLTEDCIFESVGSITLARFVDRFVILTNSLKLASKGRSGLRLSFA